MKNTRNKILTKKEINEKAQDKMRKLLEEFPKHTRPYLIDFHNQANKIDSWISEKLTKLKEKKS